MRVQLIVHTILSTRWDATTWPIVRAEVPRVLAMRAQLAREVVELNCGDDRQPVTRQCVRPR